MIQPYQIFTPTVTESMPAQMLERQLWAQVYLIAMQTPSKIGSPSQPTPSQQADAALASYRDAFWPKSFRQTPPPERPENSPVTSGLTAP